MMPALSVERVQWAALCVFFRLAESIRLVVFAQPIAWLHKRLMLNQPAASSPSIVSQCRYSYLSCKINIFIHSFRYQPSNHLVNQYIPNFYN